MRSIRWVGHLAVVAGLAVAAHSQVDGARYAGSKMCMVCHRARQKAIVEGQPKTAHFRALQAASDEAMVADFKDAPFSKDKVAWVLATGRHEQAYLDADLKVLPGLWKVKDKKWVAQEPVDGRTECIGCHVTGWNPEKNEWKAPGVGCERCHGPGSKHLTATPDDRLKTIINPKKLDAKQQAMACGQCHSRGRDKSGKLAFPHGYQVGTDLAAVFDDAKPKAAGRNQQYSDLQQSPKHWNAGIVCEKCHDPHVNTEHKYQLLMPINDTCLQCHKAKVKSIEEHTKDKKRELPAGGTCATCHMPEGRHLFDRTLADK